jgi:hypothetical protein
MASLVFEVLTSHREVNRPNGSATQGVCGKFKHAKIDPAGNSLIFKDNFLRTLT